MNYELLIAIDEALFIFLNSHHNDFWDVLMSLITHRFTSIPLYIFLIYLIIKEFRKQSFVILPFITLLIFASDRISSGLIKPYFQRLRPCYESKLQQTIHVVNGCGGEYGFVSSHAANSFAISIFLFLLFRDNKYMKWLLAWAALVSYSRIYMGVHYPGDIMCGGLLGLILAWVFYYAFTKFKVQFAI